MAQKLRAPKRRKPAPLERNAGARTGHSSRCGRHSAVSIGTVAVCMVCARPTPGNAGTMTVYAARPKEGAARMEHQAITRIIDAVISESRDRTPYISEVLASPPDVLALELASLTPHERRQSVLAFVATVADLAARIIHHDTGQDMTATTLGVIAVELRGEPAQPTPQGPRPGMVRPSGLADADAGHQ